MPYTPTDPSYRGRGNRDDGGNFETVTISRTALAGRAGGKGIKRKKPPVPPEKQTQLGRHNKRRKKEKPDKPSDSAKGSQRKWSDRQGGGRKCRGLACRRYYCLLRCDNVRAVYLNDPIVVCIL